LSAQILQFGDVLDLRKQFLPLNTDPKFLLVLFLIIFRAFFAEIASALITVVVLHLNSTRSITKITNGRVLHSNRFLFGLVLTLSGKEVVPHQ
jgi:hypothetical protein